MYVIYKDPPSLIILILQCVRIFTLELVLFIFRKYEEALTVNVIFRNVRNFKFYGFPIPTTPLTYWKGEDNFKRIHAVYA